MTANYHKREREAMEPELALQRLMAMCSRKETSEWEISKKLTAWKVDPTKQTEVVRELIKHGFLNNRRFAHAYARDKARFNKWGPRKIEQGLAMQKIDPEIVKEVLLEVENLQDDEFLLNLLKRKASTIRSENKNEFKVKLLRFGLSRGFEYDQVMSVVAVIAKSSTDSQMESP